MSLTELQPGDTIYAAKTLTNDGSLNGLADDAVLAHPGTRGVIINIGHLEEDPQAQLYLVRFEDAQANLGPAIGCWPEELSAAPQAGAGE